MINLFLLFTNEGFEFYYDHNKTKLFAKINKDNVVRIDKRHIRLEDRYTLSIHYIDKGNELDELKLRCKGKSQLEQWLSRFQTVVQPKPFAFGYDKEKYKDASVLFPIKDTQQFYLKTSYLEYFLAKGDMMKFIRLLKENKGLGNNNKDTRDHDSKIAQRQGSRNSEVNEKDISLDINRDDNCGSGRRIDQK